MEIFHFYVHLMPGTHSDWHPLNTHHYRLACQQAKGLTSETKTCGSSSDNWSETSHRKQPTDPSCLGIIQKRPRTLWPSQPERMLHNLISTSGDFCFTKIKGGANTHIQEGRFSAGGHRQNRNPGSIFCGMPPTSILTLFFELPLKGGEAPRDCSGR